MGTLLRWLPQTLREIDAEQPPTPEDAAARIRCAVGLCVAALSLWLVNYFAGRGALRFVCAHLPGFESAPGSRFWHLYGSAWWSFVYVMAYVALPLCVLRFGLGVPLREHGFGLGRTRSKLALYVALFLLVLPVIVTASFRPEFASYYPFYQDASRSWADLLAWEALYLAQFVAVEYFFRGYLLAVCRPLMGASGVFVAVLPYCMIHFGKPGAEALGAIVAGVLLGTLSLSTRSLWGGFGVHAGVALTMDLSALLQGSGLPRALWP